MNLLLPILMTVAASVASSDETALLAFKEGISRDSSVALASWNGSASFCYWEGVTCSRRKPSRVLALSLPSLGLAGTLSPAIGNLTFLQNLNLSFNWFHGEIPPSIGLLRRLRTLVLQDNSFSGTFPTNLSSCISIVFLDLSGNKLHGHIPAELANTLTHLQVLKLPNNSFTGPIPPSLSNLSSLCYLKLSWNHLEGPIPHELSNIQGLQVLDVFRNNLSGVLPPSLYNLSSLRSFVIGMNMLHGNIPTDIGSRFPSIHTLTLSYNQFSGAIPSSLSNLSQLTTLRLDVNRFSRHVPPTLGRLRALKLLDLSYNKLEANNREGWEFITSLANCSQLQNLALSSNSFRGQLPGAIVNLSATLQLLYLTDLRISGSIPSDIGNLVGLNLLVIANTSMSGAIPESIGKLANLVELFLDSNDLSGLIPSSVGNLTKLNRLIAFNNNLEGPIPTSLSKLKTIFQIDLSNNYHLNGSIPKEILELTSLSSYLDLSYNSLSGPLPSEVGYLANLNGLHLSGNQLSGQIPDSIKNCIVLEFIFLDNNSFHGSIPESLRDIKGLRILNLAMNNLSGWIPDALGSIGNLQELYLSHNNLSGAIPIILQNLTLLKLDASFNNLSYIWLLAPWPLQLSGSSKSFVAECEALRRVQHRCLIKIITCCSSIDPQGQDFKALVFEFMPNGSLYDWLHLKSAKPAPSNTLSLAQRLDIAVDIMDALDYLHNHCQTPIIHCDLKPSNVFLAEDMSAQVGDFGISRILSENTSQTLLNSTSSIGIRGSIGYVAPEYGQGCAISTLGDVYSLGILLLEMFTGRSPTNDMFKNSLDLHKFVEAALPHRAMEIADPTIWLHHEANDMYPVDTGLRRCRIHECLVSVFRLGISCSKQLARERILMRDAVAEMHAIRDAYLIVANSQKT